MTQFRYLLILFVFYLLNPISSFSQIVITEVMFNPAGSEQTDEFVEIVNTDTVASMDLKGWSIGDGDGTDQIIDAGYGVVLGPGQTGIVLDPDYFQQSVSYDSLIPDDTSILTINGSTFGSGGLSNSRPETVMLIDALGDTIDSIRYRTDLAPGYSYERIAIDFFSSDSNWCESVCLNGTPGFRNSVAIAEYDLAVTDVHYEFDSQSEYLLVTFHVLIHNLGTSSSEGAVIRAYHVTNPDSPGSSNETIFSQVLDSVVPGDSLVFSSEWSTTQYGVHSLQFDLIFPADEKTENNSLISKIQLPYPAKTLVINEIMYDPLEGSPEWIELYNPQSDPVDLQGWLLADQDTSRRYLITESAFVQGNGYVILTCDAASSPDGQSNPWVIVVPFPVFNNTVDGVFLFGPSQELIDGVNYQQTWGGGDGVSLERLQWQASSRDSSNWHGCTILEGMTPGRRNSVSVDNHVTSTRLQVQPNPFSPDGDGKDDVALINYHLPFDYANVTLALYDIRGRCIRDLRRGIESSGEGSVLWDGKDNTGRSARIGIYIVYLEALNYQSGTVIREKQTVVLAGVL